MHYEAKLLIVLLNIILTTTNLLIILFYCSNKKIILIYWILVNLCPSLIVLVKELAFHSVILKVLFDISQQASFH